MALVGLNGSGKTTLLHVLSRLVDHSSGTLLINEHESRCYDASDLHGSMSAVFQSFGKFGGTSVRENVALGAVGHSSRTRPGGEGIDATVRRAMAEAGASGFVDALEMGMDTPLEVDQSSRGFGSFSRDSHYSSQQILTTRRPPTPLLLQDHHYNYPPPPYHLGSPAGEFSDNDDDEDSDDNSPRVSRKSNRGSGAAYLSGGQVCPICPFIFSMLTTCS